MGHHRWRSCWAQLVGVQGGGGVVSAGVTSGLSPRGCVDSPTEKGRVSGKGRGLQRLRCTEREPRNQGTGSVRDAVALAAQEARSWQESEQEGPGMLGTEFAFQPMGHRDSASFLVSAGACVQGHTFGKVPGCR